MVPMQICAGDNDDDDDDDDDDEPKSHAANGLGDGRKSKPIAKKKIG